jgi:hypothetical protein
LKGSWEVEEEVVVVALGVRLVVALDPAKDFLGGVAVQEEGGCVEEETKEGGGGGGARSG